MKKYYVQMIYGIPILLFAMTMIALDVADIIDVEPFGYAFFGGIILTILYYFFRKTPPAESG